LIKYISLFLLMLSGIGCSNLSFSEKDLEGSWQAVLLTEGQDTFMYDLKDVRLNFESEQTYS